MKKIILAAASLLIATAAQSQAGNMGWIADGRGGFSSGGVTLGFTLDRDFRIGAPVRGAELTSVQGLPIKIEDFQNAERALNMSIEKTTGKTRRTSAGMDSGGSIGEGATGGGKISNDTSRETSLTRKKSMSQNQSAGQNISVDHLLRWFTWYSKTPPPVEEGRVFSLAEFGSVMAARMCSGKTDEEYRKVAILCSKEAAERILNDYHRTGGKEVKESIAAYMFSTVEPEIMAEIPSAATTGKKDNLSVAKYVALTTAANEGTERWAKGYTMAASPESLNNLATDHKSLTLIIKPGQTALALEAAGHKAEAIAKYAADAVIQWNDKKYAGINSLPDRYLAALAITKDSVSYAKKYAEAVAAGDPALKKITIAKSNSWLMSALATVAAIIAAAFYFFKNKKRGGE